MHCPLPAQFLHASLLLLTFMSFNALADDATVARFRNEAEQGWQEYVRRISKYECRTEFEWRDELADKSLRRGDSVISILGDWGIGEGEDNEEHSRWARGRNSEYRFQVRRENGLWRLEELTWNDFKDPNHSPAGAMRGPETPGLRDVCKCLTVALNWLPSMVHSPGFNLVSAEPEEGSDGFVRVDFSYEPEKGSGDYVRDGYLILDSRNLWIIREAVTEGQWSDKEHGDILIHNEFQPGTDDILLPLKHEMEWIGVLEDGEQIRHIRRTTFHDWKLAPEDESHYKVSRYGLPEPRSKANERAPLTRWILIINGIGAILLVLWLLLRNSRQGRVGDPPGTSGGGTVGQAPA